MRYNVGLMLVFRVRIQLGLNYELRLQDAIINSRAKGFKVTNVINLETKWTP